MCGRFSIYLKEELLAERFHAELPEEHIRPNYNAAPGELLPVILDSAPEQIDLIKWGFLPSWVQEPGKFKEQINARVEGIEKKPMFRNAFHKRRCLILADGFYEWARGGKWKIPHRITLKNDEPFAFAGIWDRQKIGEDEGPPSFAILTTEANELIGKIHNRMPVILRPEDEKRWLEEKEDVEEEKKMLAPYPPELMVMYPVSMEVNKPTFNNPDAIKPVDRPDIPRM